MNFTYELNCGQYVLHRDGQPIGPLLDEVALAISKEDGILHKHGPHDLVLKWHQNTSDKLRRGGFSELADDLIVICGRFPLEALNRCISTSGYALVLYRGIQAGTIAALDMHGRPQSVP